MRYQAHFNESGRSIFEAIGYIMIMILVTMSAAALVNNGLGKFRIGKVNQELMDLKKVISQRYIAMGTYEDVKMTTLCQEGIGPATVVPSKKGGCNKKGSHTYGGTVEIGPDSGGETFYITFDMLPPEACVELGSKVWVINDGSDLDWMNINGTTWKWEYSDTEQATNHYLPAKSIDVLKACSKKRNANSITWHFN